MKLMWIIHFQPKCQIEPYTEVMTSRHQHSVENADVKPGFNKQCSIEIPQTCTTSTLRNGSRVTQGLSRAALKGARVTVELAPALQVFIQGREECIIRR